ncbi:MAG TPA: IS481 family transposase [Methylibium sp.]|nr:IS481 family transposase [Methylibium sp.]HWH74190.1 IS481 family transposase [Methylibium sp.]
MEDGRCKLGLRGRIELVERVAAGATLRAAAAASGVAPATAHKWWHRYLAASDQERASGAWARARPPVPRSCPWRLTAEQEQRILDARARTNLGPAGLAGIVGFRRSTIHKVLARHGCSRRRPATQRETFRRYEWSQPGALLHMDTKRLQRFEVPGHFATGERTELARNRGSGYIYAHCVVDDNSRLGYVELHAADNAAAVTATLTRALDWMREQGCGPTQALMTDNAFVYRHNRTLRELLAEQNIKHIRTPPYTPRWNGKVERFIQTLDREWAHGRIWLNSTLRDRALSSWLRYYNRRRPHTSLGDRPPISRVHQDHGQDS